MMLSEHGHTSRMNETDTCNIATAHKKHMHMLRRTLYLQTRLFTT